MVTSHTYSLHTALHVFSGSKMIHEVRHLIVILPIGLANTASQTVAADGLIRSHTRLTITGRSHSKKTKNKQHTGHCEHLINGGRTDMTILQCFLNVQLICLRHHTQMMSSTTGSQPLFLRLGRQMEDSIHLISLNCIIAGIQRYLRCCSKALP